MGRKKKEEVETMETIESTMDTAIATAEKQKLPIEEMPLESLRDYRLYNEEARRINKKLGVCRYPLKPCPVELHPTQRVVFGRNDQPENPLDVYLSDSVIHFEKKLIPGHTYDLPQYVINYLSQKGTPVWKWRDKPDGSKETYMSHKKPRFALRTVYQD